MKIPAIITDNRKIIYVLLLIAFAIGAFMLPKSSGTRIYKKSLQEENKSIQWERDQLAEEKACLQEELNDALAYDQSKIIIDEKYKSKFFALLRENNSLKAELNAVRRIVLPYAVLDSLAGTVEYTED